MAKFVGETQIRKTPRGTGGAWYRRRGRERRHTTAVLSTVCEATRAVGVNSIFVPPRGVEVKIRVDIYVQLLNQFFLMVVRVVNGVL